MARLICLLAPFALVFSSGCAHLCCGDTDPTPTHTFGRDGTVERAGGFFGERKFCPMCEYAGTKCATCRAKEHDVAACGEHKCAKCREQHGCADCARRAEAPVCAECAKRAQSQHCSVCGKSMGPVAAKESVPNDHPRAALLPPKPADDRLEAERMLSVLETKKVPPTSEAPAKPATTATKTSKSKKPAVPQTDEPDEASQSPVTSPYNPVRKGSVVQTGR